jgi:cephalosporin hydroxylase
MWADLPGYFDYAELYDAQVAAAADGAVFVEIGVWHGRSIIYLANSIRTSGKRIRLCGVDNFQDPPPTSPTVAWPTPWN